MFIKKKNRSISSIKYLSMLVIQNSNTTSKKWHWDCVGLQSPYWNMNSLGYTKSFFFLIHLLMIYYLQLFACHRVSMAFWKYDVNIFTPFFFSLCLLFFPFCSSQEHLGNSYLGHDHWSGNDCFKKYTLAWN